MSITQTYTRCALRVLVLLGVLGAGGAWGQAPLVAYKSATGCQFYIQTTPTTLEKRIRNFVGQCSGGYYQGAIVFGESTDYRASSSGVTTVNRVTAGVVVDGRFQGVYVTLVPGLGNVWDAKSQQLVTQLDFRKGLSARDAIKQISDTASVKSVTFDAAEQVHIESVLNNFTRNADSFMAQYLNGATAKNAIPSAVQDDPKVFGRSARGG